MASALTSSFSPPSPGKKSLLERKIGVYHIIYTYDLLDRVTSMASPAGTTKYHYDDSTGRLDEIETPQGKNFHYSYDRSQLKTLQYPNGITASYALDPNGNLTDLHYQRGDGSTVQRFQYGYDKDGMRTSMTDLDGVHNYTYDSLYQIIGATHPTVQNPLERFSYDAVGNRLSDNVKSAYQYNELNELTEDDSCTYAWDADGNMVNRVSKATGDSSSYGYDAENHLVEAKTPGIIVRYTYDATGRRLRKDANGVVTEFRYDGDDMILEMIGPQGALASYTFGPGIDNPLSTTQGDTSLYYIKDGLGSVVALSDLASDVVHEYKYSTFGQIVEETGIEVRNPFTYTSREYEREIGCFYYRKRFYDANIGRFLNEDPAGLVAGVNLFAYVGNSPVNYSDPFALERKVADQTLVVDNPDGSKTATGKFSDGTTVVVTVSADGSSRTITFLGPDGSVTAQRTEHLDGKLRPDAREDENMVPENPPVTPPPAPAQPTIVKKLKDWFERFPKKFFPQPPDTNPHPTPSCGIRH